MNKTIYVLGNGKSRLKYNLEELDGTTVGCNAIYRDFSPDYLFATDFGIISEIIESGYEGDCYFTYDLWNIRHSSEYDALMARENIDHETYRRFDDEYFVYIRSEDNTCIDNKSYIFWIRRGAEHRYKNIGADLKGWSTGTSALYVACRDLAPTQVVLLGFDHEKNEYKNVYADTINYFKESNDPTGWYTWKHWKNEHDKWSNQIKQCEKEFSNIQFKK